MTNKKILIADDDPHIREIIQFALEKANMDTIIADNGKHALQKFQHHTCDLIVLDINMPKMDGLECCREIRKTSDIPILFLSSRDDEIDRILGLEIGGDDYVTKPFSPRELVARINAILKRTQQTPQGGTGLGLDIVKSLLKVWHGSIQLKPSTTGALFRIQLDIASS